MLKRIAIVGAGGWAQRMHLPAMQRIREAGAAEYVAVCDLDAARAREFATALDAELYTDQQRMLDSAKPDGVVILVPPAVTPDMIAMCASRGLPFLTEKPPAGDAATHRRLLAQVGRTPHIVGYNRRHAPYVRQALDWMKGLPLQAVFGDFARHKRTEGDFTTTLVHGVDAVQCLAGEDLADMRLDSAPGGGAINYFLSGWTASGVRLDLRITPSTGFAIEHYVMASAERSAVVAYPQPGMIDLPGSVELRERNRVIARKSAADFGIAPDDLSGLGGIVREHELFVEVLAGRAAPWSTLQTSLPTQSVRDALADMALLGGRQTRELRLCAR